MHSVRQVRGDLNDSHFAVKSHQRSIQVTDLTNTSEDQHLRNFEHKIPFATSVEHTAMRGYVIHFVKISIHSKVSNVDKAFVERTVNPPEM